MADDPLKIVVNPAPKEGNPWGVQSVTPVPTQSNAWAPVDTKPLQPDNAAQPPVDQSGSKPWYVKAVEPLTTYLPTQRKMASEGFDQMTGGAVELGKGVANKFGAKYTSPDAQGNDKPSTIGSGAFDAGIGGLKYLGSPIEAALHTVVGKPFEENFNLPHDKTEFAAGLLIPYYGLTGTAPAKAIEKILSPTTVDANAQTAATAIRGAGGTAARDTAQTVDQLEPARKVINAMPVPDRLQFLDYVEGRSTTHAGQTAANPQLQSLADSLRTAFEARKTKLQQLGPTAQASFIEDYFPHFWKDQNAARQAAMSFGGGVAKQGSGASLKGRTVPTIADGIAQGLEPLYTDPIEAALKYVNSMDHFIAAADVLEQGKSAGTVRYLKPKTVGASGRPDSFQVPDGWVPINGRGSVRFDGARAYAPEGFARVYNNFIDKGFFARSEFGDMYQTAQQASNAITSLELGLSGFHAYTMAQESVIAEFAKGVRQLSNGNPVKAIKSMGNSVTMPLRPLLPELMGNTGKKVEQVYLGRSQGTPDFRRIVKLLEQAGGRAVGSGHAADYQYSAMGSYFTAWKRGALKAELQADKSLMFQKPITGTAQVVAKNIGRVMSTVAQPLFEKYIPRLKNAAFYDNMKGWMDAHPAASHAEQVAEAQRIWDSVDNRFGEMVQDNIFWNKTLRQSAQLGMRSFSWNLGTAREIGGGVKDVLDGKGMTERASYLVAAPIVWMLNGAVYEYLKTGKAPEDLDQLVDTMTRGPRTGGVDSDTGEAERVRLPGYQNDVMGWYHDWRAEIKNKMSTGLRLGVAEPLSGTDWKGQPITDPRLSTTDPAWLKQYFEHVTDSLGPISLKNMFRSKDGSNLNFGEKAFGFNAAGRRQTDPEGFEVMMDKVHARQWKTKTNYDRRDKDRYGGTE